MAGGLGELWFKRAGKVLMDKPSPPKAPLLAFSGDAIPKNLWWVMGLSLGGIIVLIRRRGKHGLRLCCGGDYKAFVQRLVVAPPGPASPSTPRALKDLNFAVKDVFDVEWYITGFGCPEWTRTHDAPTRSAVAVSVLVQAGATCVGKTTMDEMGFSLDGCNHDSIGRPVNPGAAYHMVGGSSGGSAVAVSGDLVDFALGVDTVGDVRLPAACCDILGYRASHGAVSTVGVLPVAQSLDAVGWFAKDPQVLRQVGLVLLQYPLREELRSPRRIYVADDLFKSSGFLIEHALDVILRAIVKLFGRQVLHHINLGELLTQKLPTLKAFANVETRLVDTAGAEAYSIIRDSMFMLYRDEFLRNHHDWLNKLKPKLGRGIAGKVRASYELTSSTHLLPTARQVREETRAAFSDLLKHETLIVIPTTPGAPPKLSDEERIREKFLGDASLMMCLSTMSGGPQVTVPTGHVDGLPVAVSLLARYSGDRLLLDTVQSLFPAIAEDRMIARRPSRI